MPDADPQTHRRRRRLVPGGRDLDAYLGEIGRAPIPDAGEVASLIAIIRDDGRPAAERLAARNRLVEGNLRLVVALAKRFRHRGLDYEDLIGAGQLGLIRAIDDYDPARAAFSTYAAHWIMQCIRSALASQTRAVRVSHSAHWLVGRHRRAEAALMGRLGRSPTPEEVRVEMGVPIAQWGRVADAVAAGRCGSIGETPVRDRTESPDDAAARAEVSDQLRDILRFLPARDADVLRRHYGEGQTLAEIGADLGITRERVRQIANRAMEMARAVATGAHGGSLAAATRATKLKMGRYGGAATRREQRERAA